MGKLDREVVWLKSARHFAWLVSRGAWYSEVEWTENGVTITDTVENNDYEFWEERAIEFDSE